MNSQDQAFPGTSDTRTAEEVEQHIRADNLRLADFERAAISKHEADKVAQEPVDKASVLCDLGVHPVAVIEEELEDNCARVRWIYNPVPVGQELRWEHPASTNPAAQERAEPVVPAVGEHEALRIADAIDPFTRTQAPDHLTMGVAAKLLRELSATPPAPAQPSPESKPEQAEAPNSWRKKPVVIQAVQLRWDTWQEMCVHAGVGNLSDGKPEGFWPDGVGRGRIGMHIPTLEGLMEATENDWIIRGIKGELYPCKPDIFEATYERATLPPAIAAGDSWAGERELFEDWYFDKQMHPPAKDPDGTYSSFHARYAWSAWQARAALATKPQAEQEAAKGDELDWVQSNGSRLSWGPRTIGPGHGWRLDGREVFSLRDAIRAASNSGGAAP